MRMWWMIVGVMLGMMHLAGRVQAADYYVRAAGSDAQAGTSVNTAWQTLTRVQQQTFQPGDRILLHGGETFAGSLVLTSAGTTTKPITLAAFGRGRATIQAGNGTGVLIRNAGGWSVKDLAVVGAGRETNTGSGLVFRNEQPGSTRLTAIRVENVDVDGFGRHGILIEGAAADKSRSGYRDVRLVRCTAYDNALSGITVTGVYEPRTARCAHAEVTVDHCLAYDNPGDPNFLDLPSGSGIVLEGVDGGVIERCVARNNGALCGCKTGGPAGIRVVAANNIVIQQCESHHNHTSAQSLDGGGFACEGGVTNSVLQYNYSHDNDGAGALLTNRADSPYTFRNNSVRYNISQNDGRKHHYSSLQVGGDVRDCNLYNNTVFVSPSTGATPGALFVGGGRNLRVCNNILLTTGGTRLAEVRDNADVLLRGNDYWSSGERFQIVWNGKSYGSLVTFQAATRQETKPSQNGGTAVGLAVDPLLVKPGKGPTLNNADLLPRLDSYRLQPRSPLINAGVDLPVYYGVHVGDRDFYGDHLPNGDEYDIGAHERK